MLEVKENKPEKEIPPLTAKNILTDIYNGIFALLNNSATNSFAVLITVCLSSIACKIIISKVKYTEIDFSTYMQQIQMVNDGALDYSIIGGDTGPIVYPAGYVQIYQGLHWLTGGGEDLEIAQFAFGYLFTFTVFLSGIVYATSAAPPWTIYLLLASKRLYSIYVLRLFNDCFTTAGVIAVVMLLQQAANWSGVLSDSMMFLLCAAAADLYSMALSVKMNALLYLPAFAYVVYFLLGEQLHKLVAVLLVIPAVQVMVGWHFLLPLFWDEEACRLRNNYLKNAFDFSRQFMYKWTVNWRFVPEDVFLSKEFSTLLLVGHISVLCVFLLTRFASPKLTGKSISALFKDAFLRPLAATRSKQNKIVNPATGPRTILLIFSVTNLIGILFARSLHYQFLSWYCWLLPFLLHAAGFNVFFGSAIFLAHEWCWNVFPSTENSSKLLILILSIILVATWNNSSFWFQDNESQAQKPKAPKLD